jgi:hypothetical protein
VPGYALKRLPVACDLSHADTPDACWPTPALSLACPCPTLWPADLPSCLYPAADCLAICAALAEGIPGRVAQELLSVCGISPAVAAATPMGQAGEVPLLSRVLGAEGAAGSYPATQAFLRLLTTLVSGGQCGAVLSCRAVMQRDVLWRAAGWDGMARSCAGCPAGSFASAVGHRAPIPFPLPSP